MTIEQQVVSLDLARQLKEAGYPQDESLFTLQVAKGGIVNVPHVVMRGRFIEGPIVDTYAAPTVAELGEALPEHVLGKIKISTCYYWEVEIPKTNVASHGVSEAEARARMWLYLKQNNLLSADESKEGAE